MDSQKRNLKIMTFNCNGIISKLKEIESFLESNKIDIALINETNLKPSKKIYLKNYDIYRSDNIESQKGGNAIFIKRNIKHKRINIPKIESLSNVIGIKLFLSNESFAVFNIYLRPRVKLNTRDLINLCAINEKVIIGGDFNSKNKKWLCHSTDSNGKILEDFLNNNSSRIKLVSSDTPTYSPISKKKRPSIIDYFLAKKVIMTKPICKVDLDSDHVPVISVILLNNNDIETYLEKLDYNKTNWKHYRTILHEKTNHLVNINSEELLEENITILSNNISETLNKCTPKIKDFKDELPRFILAAIKYRNKIRRRYNKYGRQEDKTIINKVSRKIKESIQNYNNKKWEKSDSIKYLGVTLDKKLKFNIHIQNTIKKAKVAMNKIFSLIKYDSELNTVHTFMKN
uniref:Endonuclease/exonuclease/phosphatase domain-containing protein n=1 Tax=Phlebotomus papatasi TaxID=29031 RepID=A0A1B0DGV7_PHLPP